MRYSFFLILIFLACGATTFAQGKKDKKSKRSNKQTEVNQPTSMDPSYPTMNYAPKSGRRDSKFELTYNAEKRYFEQMERVAKARKKAEKELMKPQYSDPMYFGHKRPPKKRPPGKMKYCKECGIRH